MTRYDIYLSSLLFIHPIEPSTFSIVSKVGIGMCCEYREREREQQTSPDVSALAENWQRVNERILACWNFISVWQLQPDTLENGHKQDERSLSTTSGLDRFKKSMSRGSIPARPSEISDEDISKRQSHGMITDNQSNYHSYVTGSPLSNAENSAKEPLCDTSVSSVSADGVTSPTALNT